MQTGEEALRLMELARQSGTLPVRRPPEPPRHPVTIRGRTVAIGAAAAVVVVLSIYAAIERPWAPMLPTPPAGAEQRYERGVGLLHEAAYAGAALLFEQAVELHDEYPLAHARLAEALVQLDEQDRAQTVALYANQLVPDRSRLEPTDALYLDAITDTVRRDFPAAIENYAALVELLPDRPEVRFELGRAYEIDDQPEKALAEFDAAIAVDELYAPARVWRAVLLGRDARLGEALESFDAADRLSQSNPEGLIESIYRRGALFNALRRHAEAAGQLERALRLAVDFDLRDQQIRALGQLSVVMRNTGDFDAAERHTERAIDLAADRPRLRANALIDLGYFFQLKQPREFDRAEASFRQGLDLADAVDARRTKARAQGALAAILRGRDNSEVLQLAQEAADFYRRGGYRRPAVQAMTLVGFVQNLRGQLQPAEDTFREQHAIAVRHGDDALIASAGISLADALSRRGEFPAALSEVVNSRRLYEELGVTRSLAFAMRDQAGLLAQLGLPGRAETILATLVEDARFAADYPRMRGTVDVVQARLALTRQRFDEVLRLTDRVLGDGPSVRVAVDALALRCLAQARVRRHGEAKDTCADGRRRATEGEEPDPVRVSSILLADAEARLLAGEPADELAAAEQALEAASGLDRTEQRWRAAALAAQASAELDRDGDVDRYREQSLAGLDDLRERWVGEGVDTYLERDDIIALARAVSP